MKKYQENPITGTEPFEVIISVEKKLVFINGRVQLCNRSLQEQLDTIFAA